MCAIMPRPVRLTEDLCAFKYQAPGELELPATGRVTASPGTGIMLFLERLGESRGRWLKARVPSGQVVRIGLDGRRPVVFAPIADMEGTV